MKTNQKQNARSWIASILIFFWLIGPVGCATAPSLSLTEDDVNTIIKGLTSKPPSDPDAVKYNSADDTYSIKKPYGDKALNDSVRVKGYEEIVIPRYLDWSAKHPPMTFWKKLTWFGYGLLSGLVLGAVGAVYLQGR